MYRAWNISFQRHDFLLVIRVCGRDCGEQRFCVRMHRMIEHSFGRCKLHNISKIHDTDPVTNIFYHTQAVRDKQICQIFLSPQIF